MKIEKISDTQIRCTLSKQDLAERELKISELAYGSDKAKDLFRELMLQASYECGFEADDIPLMIEAIPISSESLVLVVTKVEDPEELDTRFSNFSSFNEKGIDEKSFSPTSFADEIIDCFGQLGELLGKAKNDKNVTEYVEKEKEEKSVENKKLQFAVAKFYSFADLETVTSLSKVIASYYFGRNALYKDPVSSKYFLYVEMSEHTPEEFNKVCNTIAEYGTVEQPGTISLSYCKEHFTSVLLEDAIQTLSAF